MGCNQWPPMARAGFLVLELAVMFSLVALAIPYWQQTDSISAGLWVVCSTSTCLAFSGTIPAWMGATRFFMIAEFILTLTASILINFALDKNQSKQGKIAMILIFVGGFCGMIAMASYTSNVMLTTGVTWGAGYVLGWIAWLFSWIAAGLFFKPVSAL